VQLASRHSAATYLATAHRVLSEVARTRGTLAEAEAEAAAALCALGEAPAPLEAWRAYASVARLHTARGEPAAARQHFRKAAVLLRSIAANVGDEGLRRGFLGSKPVEDILGAERA
jgi:hypothetical protein